MTNFLNKKQGEKAIGIKSHSVIEAKKTGDIQFIIQFSGRDFTVDIATGSVMKNEEAIPGFILFIYKEEQLINIVEVSSNLLEKFEHMSAHLEVNKDEVYVTCYEFPYEDENLIEHESTLEEE